MSSIELRWRATAAARAAAERVRCAAVPPRWNRRALARELAGDETLADVRDALDRGRWLEAHEALLVRLARAPQRFLIAPALRRDVARRIDGRIPDACADAATRANRIVAGEYDLLGYERLRCEGWHRDPVSGREAPRRFWTAVPFLDPACGDHKVIWEFNRHQHWLALGRAYWLTGDHRYRAACLAQLATWMDENPPLAGINWASMLELAFRSLSWIWAIQFFAEPVDSDDAPWLVDLLLGLTRQLRHVEQNLSHFFSPNTHLLGEALALYVAGRVLPELAASARWAEIGRTILVREIGRQITTDGGHAERSAHYHRYTLDFYLMALAVARISGDSRQTVQHFEQAAARLAFVCRVLADDHGRLPQLGDDDGGSLMPICGRPPHDVQDTLAIAAALVDRPELRIGPAPEEAFWFLAHPALVEALHRTEAAALPEPLPSTALPDTGYFVARSASGDHLIVDAGPHGYQNGGHAHADALSLTFSVRGNPLLIDPGTGCYTIDTAVRNRFRSTLLHNTVVIDDQPQSVPAGPFHWTRMASASAIRWRANGAFDYFEGVHDGYAPIEHRRHLLVVPGDLLIVADLISASGEPATEEAAREHSVAAHWHLDPSWSVDASGRRAQLSTAGDRVDLITPDAAIEVFNADRERGLGWCAPAYGRIVPTNTLRLERRGALPIWLLGVFGLNPASPIDRVEYLPVWSEAGALSSSVAIRIIRRTATDYFAVAHPSDPRPMVAPDTNLSRSISRHAAGPAVRTWRVGEFETDAAMFFCRILEDGRAARVGLVDSSIFRAANRRVAIALPRIVPDLNVDVATADPAQTSNARLSGPGFGARIVVAGRELPIAIERRSSPRSAPNPVPVNE